MPRTPLAPTRAFGTAVVAAMACLLSLSVPFVSSTPTRPSLHALPCIVVGGGTGPISRTVTVCPPVASNALAH